MGPERHVIYIKNIKCVCLLGIKLRFVDLRFAAPSSETHSTDLDRAVRPDWRPLDEKRFHQASERHRRRQPGRFDAKQVD